MAMVSGLTFVSRILGYVRDVLIGATFGDSGVSDVFFQAFRLPNLFRSLFAEGALNSAFVPMFGRLHHKEGRLKALDFARLVFTVLVLILLVLVLIFELNMEGIMSILAPGFRKDPEKFHMVVQFGHIVFPYILFIALSALCAGILNSLNRFSAAASAPILLNLFCIASLVLFSFNVLDAGKALSWAVTLAGVAQFIWVLWACARNKMVLRPVRLRMTEELKTLLRRMGPGIAGAGVYQVNLLISTGVASFVPMAVSYLAFADRINQFPLSITGIAIGTVLLPLLTRHVAANRHEESIYIQNRVLQFSFVLTLPAAFALVILSVPIVTVLFQHGRFTSLMSLEVAKVLSIYVLCLPANVVVKTLNANFFSRGNTRIPMIVASVSILSNLFFIALLFPLFSYYGIAMAATFASFVNAGALGYLLHRRQYFKPDKRLKETFPRILAAAGLMGAFLYGSISWLNLTWAEGILENVFFLGLLIIGGGVFYLILILWFNGASLKEFKEVMKRTSEDIIINEREL
jgi:putative peptidoglycan lipid II flippase